MSKQSLLLVDGDARSLRVLEVSLRKAGFTVTTAINGPDALDKLALATPDLVISETKLEEMDGFELCKRIKANPLWIDIPFVFLTAQTAIEHKVKGLELGVDDYLTKPIYIKEVVTRLQILLQKRQRTRIEERRDGRTRFVGRLSDMAVVDLIQTIEISRKSGVIQFTGDAGRQAAIYFRDGKVIDAEAGPLQGEDAVYRLLTWNDGAFEVVFRTVRRRDVITTPSQGLLMEGMRRLDEWSRLCEQLPPLDTRFEVDTRELTQRLGDIPDENNTILKLMDGRRSLHEVIDACSVGDLECLQAVSRLYFEGLLLEASDGRGIDVERKTASATGKTEDSSQWIVPATVFDETPVEAERIVVGGTRQTGPMPVSRVVTVPQPTGREGSGPRTIPPPPPPGRRGAGSGPVPIARTDTEGPRATPDSARVTAAAAAAMSDSGRITTPATPDSGRVRSKVGTDSGRVATPTVGDSGRVPAAAMVTESGRIAAPPAEVGLAAAAPAPTEASIRRPPTAPPVAPATPTIAGPAAVAAELRTQFTAIDPAGDAVPIEQRVRSPSGSIEVGELHGAFRPSGLRKIDEAVMAAQLIAPELFIDEVDDAVPGLPSLAPPAVRAEPAADPASAAAAELFADAEPPAASPALAPAADAAPSAERAAAADPGPSTPSEADLAAAELFAEEPSYVFESDLGSIPEEYLDDDDRPIRETGSLGEGRLDFAAFAVEDEAPPPRVQGSNPRIVASHGKDQAQVSGELPLRSQEWPEKEITARELITIKPRRITREMPAVVPSPELLADVEEAEAAEAAAMVVAATRSSAAMTSTAIPVQDSAGASGRGAAVPTPSSVAPSTAVERPHPPSRPPRAGSGTSSVVPPPSTSVGWMPWILGAVGIALVSGAYIRCRRNSHTPAVVAEADARPVLEAAADAPAPPDASELAAGPIDAGTEVAVADAGAPATTDAVGLAVATIDAGAAQTDAGSPLYREYRDKAADALADSDYAAALDWADKSLALSKSARTYLIKADALRRLHRIDDALAAIDAAISREPNYAPSWELKGRILWAVRRFDEGRAAYERFLDIRPDGATADRIREILKQ